MLLLGAAASAQAVQFNCSDFPLVNGFHVIDGDPSLPPTSPPSIPAPDNIKIDVDCRIQNYPESDYPFGINTNFSFDNNDPTPYLVIFDNVYHVGNMSCNTVAEHKIWFTNGSSSKILEGNCQNLLIPVEMIDKRAEDSAGNEITSVTVGVPFNYSLNVPVLFDAGSGTVLVDNGSLNDISKIHIEDDLSAAALGVDLTYLGHTIVYRDPNDVETPLTAGVDYSFSNVGGVLTFENFSPAVVPAGGQFLIDVAVRLEDTALNAPGTSFTNVATWEFAREIDGIFYDPLPGENGTAELVTISEPDLTLNKSSDSTAINFGDTPLYTLDIQNVGGFEAWNITVEDVLPTGMCATDPTGSLTAQVLASDGSTVLRTLNLATGYTLSYDSGTCLLVVTLTDSAGAVDPNQYLRVTYNSQLDPLGSPDVPADGDTLTNVAAATEWFNDSSSNGSRLSYSGPRTDGTPAITDNQDNATVTAGLSGYYFEKTVDNLTTGVSPTTSAAPGDQLHYEIRLFNLDQEVNAVTITDQLDMSSFVAGSPAVTNCPANATCSIDASGLLTVTGNGVDLDVVPPSDIVVEFVVTLKTTLGNGATVSNQANLAASDSGGNPVSSLSDDPNVNGVRDASDPASPSADPTDITIVMPGPLSKVTTPAVTEAAIGDQVTYRITIPETPTASPLYDVRILDDLSASGVDLSFVSATVVSGGSWVLTNTGTANNLVIEDVSTGIDIPAYGQAVIDITLRLLNTTNNQAGDTFTNTASYTFNRGNGNTALQTSAPGGPNDTAAQVTVVEPALAFLKVVRNVTPGKSATDPAAGGDILEYILVMSNSGSASDAYDLTVTDTLPSGLTLIAGSATANIGGSPVAGFVADPTEPGGGVLIWGDDNGDGSLDIPAGQLMSMTYRVNVTDASSATLDNSAVVEWTSQNGANSSERSGAGCPNITQPDDYCAGPATASITTVDTNALTKSIVSDTWNDSMSTASDGVLRVGDTVVYRLALNLREGQTSAVVVSDTLPSGLVFDSVVGINGDTTAPYSAVSPFSHNDIAAPTVDAGTNTVTWNIGDIDNAINNDTSDDTFVIEYRARVATDTLTQTATTTLTNNASFSYDSGKVLNDSANIEVRQPVLVSMTKTDQLGNSYPNSGAPLNVDIGSDVMQFRLQACNDSGSTAPAYSLQMVDTLASELDETSISTPVVTVNGAAQSDGVGYNYTPPAARGGTLTFDLVTPVNPGQCALVEYSIGFHTDVAANQLWNNSVTAAEYWSLPSASGQQYAAVGPAEFWMTNQASDPLPVKTLVSPGTEAAIGETVTYDITIPARNAVRNNVVISDTLPTALVYDGASATIGGSPAALVDNSTPPNQVSLTIATIPAGQETVITLTTHVANTAATNAGNTFNNTATYTYSGYSGTALTSAPTSTLTIVEPLVSVAKSVSPTNPPIAGDILTYTVDMTATGGANFSDAHDLVLSDTLSIGLAYVPGSATIAGVPVEPTVTGDGVTTAQTMTWSNIEIPEGTGVTAVYDVEVMNNVTPGQVLANYATATWTSLSGANANERDGSGGINDYSATDSTNLGAPDNTTLAKTLQSDTFNSGTSDLRVGDRAQFELRIGLQEGTHNDLVLTDTLPAGMVFEGMVSADYFGTAGTATPAISGQTLTWNLGTQVNPADGDPANDYIVLVYEARVENNDTLSQTPTTQVLFNAATLDYTVAGVAVPTKRSNVTVDVLQPDLSVTKTASAAGGDTVVAAGETVTYTVDIINSGDAPAYDTVLTDTLPVGMRQGGVTTTSLTLVNAATSLPVLAPGYDSVTGIATWDFDSGSADAYTIPAGDTLRVVYTAQVDPDVGASLTLDNLAQVTVYYSFDDEAVPTNGVVAEREDYGPSNTATTSLTTPAPGALSKVESVSTIGVGEPFTYRITVPATPVDTALFDVRIVDDLGASAAVMNFVSVARAPSTATVNTGAWTPVNTGNSTQLVIEDITTGIDIPAGEQIAVDITVELLDDPNNVAGLVFNNTADYTFNNVNNDAASQLAGAPGTSGDTTIVEPTLVMSKSGPDTMGAGTPEIFTLEVQNTGSGPAWDITLTDHLPNPAAGGMCDNPPQIVSARVYDTDGSTLLATLVENTDFVTTFTAGSPCVYTFTGQTAAAALEAGQFLRVEYQAELDTGTPANTELTNYAGATEWFSADDTAPSRRSYTHTLVDVQESNVDPQDYHTLTTNFPDMTVEKTVSLQNDVDGNGLANPGDTLRYTITVTNISEVLLPDFQLVDDLGALHSEVVFKRGSLVMVSVPAGATDNSDPVGGTNRAGLVDVRDLSLGAQGTPEETVTLSFDVTLATPIDNGTVVLNQGHLDAFGFTVQLTDDPSLAGDEDPTEITVYSAPDMQVEKISEDLTGDTSVLAPGDTLRYTLTVWNIGDENAVNVMLRDAIPQYTTYVADSTTLNGSSVADPSPGVSPLVDGILVNSAGNSTAGAIDADSGLPDSVATVTFSVTINDTALLGTRIVNQGFVTGSGGGGTAFPEQASDDPSTAVPDDPTEDVVGAVPLLDVQKTVQLDNDLNGNNAPDPDDTLLYTFVVRNTADITASGVQLTDQIPADTTYVPGSTTLNGSPLADVAGASPLESGLAVNSAGEASGVVAGNSAATVTFRVTIDTGVAGGTVISNQGLLASNEQADEPTDADGVDSNGDQPTQIIVGSAQQLSIVKGVSVVGGGAALPGSELEYTVQVSNTGAVPATQVVITDDLNSLAGVATYVNASARLNGGTGGVSETAGVLTADYGTTYGDLAVGATATLRFRVLVDNTVPVGTSVSNTGVVSWDNGNRTASSNVTTEIGGIPGTATLRGRGWHDANFDNSYDNVEQLLSGWTVRLYRNSIQLLSTTTDSDGYYSFIGLPETQAGETYELRFEAPGAGASTAKLGLADSAFTNELQRITGITASADSVVNDLNLPIDPDGVVYNSINRAPVAGATLTLVDASGSPVDPSCFDDPAQQGQLTTDIGFYKFDLNFGHASCPSGADYLIQVVAPTNGNYEPGVSRIIAPTTSVDTAAYDAASCSGDAVAGTAACEAQASPSQPPVSVAADSPLTDYYLNLSFSNTDIPNDSQIFNNHIPLDPVLAGAVSITKTAAVVNVSRGEFVPYAIRIRNTYGYAIPDLAIVDSFPAGFKYVADSARLDGQPVELASVGRRLILNNLDLAADGEHTLKMLFIVGAGVSEGEYINRAQMFHTITSGGESVLDTAVSGEASAAVRVVPNPDFDCTDVIGKVFDDANLNGYQDEGEAGLPGVRAVTARGLVVTSDENGRFHITCAVVPNENRGSNFILKVDDRSLPTGYRLTTENPLVHRATRGKMVKFNFGAALHRVVRLDIADGVFQPGTAEMRLQWKSRLPLLMKQLEAGPSLLRLSYMAEVERKGLVEKRLKAMKRLIKEQWAEMGNPYELVIETEVFWRTGAPPQRSSTQ